MGALFFILFGICLGLLATLIAALGGSREIRVGLAISWGILAFVLFGLEVGFRKIEAAAAAGLAIAALSAILTRRWTIAAFCTVVCCATAAKLIIDATNLTIGATGLYSQLRLVSEVSGGLIGLVYPCAGILLGIALTRRTQPPR